MYFKYPTAAGDDAPSNKAIQEELRINRFFYGLGLATQTILWFLLFLAIVGAYVAGSYIIEFRYVGF